jgi:serpin B
MGKKRKPLEQRTAEDYMEAADGSIELAKVLAGQGGIGDQDFLERMARSDTNDEEWSGANTRKVPMMHRKGGFFYYESDSFQALEIPYRGQVYSMPIVLPRTKDGLVALERKMAEGKTFDDIATALVHEESVLVSLPRFKLKMHFMLRPVLCAMHAELAFSAAADFSNIGDEPVTISEVVHNAFVEVNEEGTEASAATAVLMLRGISARPSLKLKVFKADHPFLFFIRDRKTNTVLFSGRVVDPK